MIRPVSSGSPLSPMPSPPAANTLTGLLCSHRRSFARLLASSSVSVRKRRGGSKCSFAATTAARSLLLASTSAERKPNSIAQLPQLWPSGIGRRRAITWPETVLSSPGGATSSSVCGSSSSGSGGGGAASCFVLIVSVYAPARSTERDCAITL